jgi:hypothetical protein
VPPLWSHDLEETWWTIGFSGSWIAAAAPQGLALGGLASLAAVACTLRAVIL